MSLGDASGSEGLPVTVQADFSALSGLAISAIIYTGVILLLMTGNWFFYRRYRNSYYDDDEYDDYDAGKAPAPRSE